MAMTKKDYEMVATALANQRQSISKRVDIELTTIDATIEGIAAHFALMNNKFNSEAFMEAARHGKGSNTGF